MSGRSAAVLATALLAWMTVDGSKNQNQAQPSVASVQVAPDPANRKIDVLIGGQPFTAYIYPTVLKKPVLFPLRTAEGSLVTRGFPPGP